ncbi:MAG TPA: rRNA maturation RNase YbeY [Candidatus Caccovivens faecavium]|nr:rRNA maturation RNase YbeY [Candidatus Caccovivens faecavium]
MKIEGKIGLYKRTILKIFKICERVLKEDFKDVYVSINSVSDEEIQKLNREFRNIDKVTDVLSFPNLNKSSNEKLKKFSKFADFDTNLLFLGDIVISKNVAKKQAREYGHSLKREVCFLALHGFLHLLGFDHIKEEDEKIMIKLQNKILNEANL